MAVPCHSGGRGGRDGRHWRAGLLDVPRRAEPDAAGRKGRGCACAGRLCAVKRPAAHLCAEDRRFYEHGGFDVISTARAALANLRTGTLAEGGSTLTQQLAKNLYFTQEKKFTRKVAELFTAWALEANYTKDEILELYINVIYYGDGCTGITAAAQHYFGKAPSELTDYECTLLAGVPNAPSIYAPTANPELCAQRQRRVLDSMVEAGYLTQAQADAVLEEGGAMAA